MELAVPGGVWLRQGAEQAAASAAAAPAERRCCAGWLAFGGVLLLCCTVQGRLRGSQAHNFQDGGYQHEEQPAVGCRHTELHPGFLLGAGAREKQALR